MRLTGLEFLESLVMTSVYKCVDLGCVELWIYKWVDLDFAHFSCQQTMILPNLSRLAKLNHYTLSKSILHDSSHQMSPLPRHSETKMWISDINARGYDSLLQQLPDLGDFRIFFDLTVELNVKDYGVKGDALKAMETLHQEQ
ncbi:hypothetical protein L1987_74346 [Smallanthus sonchifolius]|uniref:Uncharacterized protein n=1 Tax=Smallanthus sonchifolius TaxID=185202 RepID=A0ACB9A1X9_9ASTR|nr:hypothetical protein L1987_74346 [Smallanthus sonchifolius]